MENQRMELLAIIERHPEICPMLLAILRELRAK